MKILIATGLYSPDIGGPATYTKMLESELPERGIDVVVAPFGSVRKYPKIFRHIVYMLLLLRMSKGQDIIYALDPVSVGLPACIASFFTGKKFMIRIPGDYAWEQGQQRFGVTDLLDEFVTNENTYSIPVRVLKVLQSSVTKRASMVIVPSDYMKGVVAQWGVDSKKIHRIYSALQPMDEKELENIYDVESTKGVRLVTAGRLVPWKGVETLIDIFPKLRDTLGNVTFEIIGDGPLLNAYEQKVKELHLEKVIHFLGKLSRTELYLRLHKSDVFILNTAYEGMSHQLLEVMSIGLPIVTTNVGGNPELIENEATGLLVPYNDKEALVVAIERMVSDKKLRETVALNGRKKLKYFNRKTVVEELAQLLKEI